MTRRVRAAQRPAFGYSLGASLLLHAGLVVLTVIAVRDSAGDTLARPPVYKVSLVAAPAGPRQMGVVRPPTSEPAPTPPPEPQPPPPAPHRLTQEDVFAARREILGGAKGPAPAALHQVHAAVGVERLQFREQPRNIGTFRQQSSQVASAQGLRGREERRLEEP